MKTNKKVFFIVVILMVLSACSGRFLPPTPTLTEIPPTQTALPTYTPYPTYTSVPTFTAVPPTPVPPTPAPLANIDAVQVPCPNGQVWPTGIAKGKCYEIDDGDAVGIIFYDSKDRPVAIGATMSANGSTDLAEDMGNFLGQAAISVGWSNEDAANAVALVQQEDVWYTYGSIQARIVRSNDGEYFSVYIKPADPSGSSG